MKKSWEEFDGELPNGKEVTVYYDHASSLTVVPNYAQGRTLIFNDEDLHDEALDPKKIVSCIVANSMLENLTPAEIFEAACEKDN